MNEKDVLVYQLIVIRIEIKVGEERKKAAACGK